MKDQELITELMLLEKKMGANYDSFASECVNTKLRDTFVSMLARSHNTQTTLFTTAQEKGWYQVEQAPARKVDQARQKFTNQAPTLT